MTIALWGGAGMWLQADSLAHTDASTPAFLTQAYCIFLPLWACLRTRRMPGSRVILSTLMVITGGTILSGLRPDNLKLGRGEIEALCAAFLFTFQILPAMLGEFIGATYQNETISLAMITGGTLIIGANLIMQWKRPPHLPPAGPVTNF